MPEHSKNHIILYRIISPFIYAILSPFDAQLVFVPGVTAGLLDASGSRSPGRDRGEELDLGGSSGLCKAVGYCGMVVEPTSYPLVNIQKAMENHHFQWENPL